MSKSPYVDIIFGPYLPDMGGQPNPASPGYLVDAVNVRSTPHGYRGMPSFTDVPSAVAIGVGLSDTGYGAYFNNGSTNYHFVVIGDNIYEARGDTSTWEDVTAGGDSAAVDGDFVSFGNDVVFVSKVDAPLSKDLTASHATDFSNLAGSPPTGRCAARIGNHLVIGGLSTDVYAVRTSAIGDHEDWPTPGTADARAKQSISESLNPEYGDLMRILPGEKFGIVMQMHALTRMTYVGGSSVYQFDTFERINGRGIAFFSRPVTDGKVWYWYTDGGVFATDGYSVTNLSHGKIDEAIFLDSIDFPISITSPYSGAYDEKRKLVLFAVNNHGPAAHQLTYNVADGSFAILNHSDGQVFWSGDSSSNRNVYNINGSNFKLQTFTGATGTIAMQTGYIELDPGYRVQIQGAHLLGANIPSTLTLSYKGANSLDDIDVLQTGFSNFTAPNRGLKSTARADAPFFAFRISGTGSESHLYRGIRVYYERSAPQ